MIKIRPQAGLGNRLRALDSAVSLSHKLNKKLEIIWVKNVDFNCSLHELFQLSKDFSYKERSTLIRDNGRLEKLLLPLNRLIKTVLWPKMKFYSNQDIIKIKNRADFIGLMSSSKDLWIQTETSFLNNPNPFSYLIPIDEIETIVSNITKNYSSNTTGIHIRRSDNTFARKQSPTNLFIKKIKEEIITTENSIFFLATDSAEEEQILKNEFGDLIITYKKRSYDRNNNIAIKDALIDMLCLSRTNKILGSYYSSFSEIAAEMGRIPLMIVKNQNYT